MLGLKVLIAPQTTSNSNVLYSTTYYGKELRYRLMLSVPHQHSRRLKLKVKTIAEHIHAHNSLPPSR